jgi:hypothetical protein
MLFISGGALAESVSPPIRHVFIVVLENESEGVTFGPGSKATYLSKELPARGALLPRYYGIGHDSLDNYIAMISGQGVNPVTQDDCDVFEPFVQTGVGPYGQAIGRGCVYPKSVLTIADQLTAGGLSWKGYMEDMGADPKREAARCGHPEIGAKDNTQVATPRDQYATRHNPFVYFHSVIDAPICEKAVVPLPELASDLQKIETTPAYSFITPNLCNDGHDGPDGQGCADKSRSGQVTVDAFLRHWVPLITGSPAFRKDGLLIITFDESDMHHRTDRATRRRVLYGDASSCCGEAAGPNLDRNAVIDDARVRGPGIIGPGGGRIGAVALSPFIRPGTVSKTPYNHYGLLRTTEDLFGLSHLGYAAQPEVRAMGADVFTAWSGR